MTDEQLQQERIRAEHLISTTAHAVAQSVAASAEHAARQVVATADRAAHVLAEATRVDMQYIKQDLNEIKVRLESKFVSLEAFDPVRRLVYGIVGLILIAVVGGLLALVLRS